MDFIDETCVIFDNEDENKFAYTEAHAAFRDLVRHAMTYEPGEASQLIEGVVGRAWWWSGGTAAV